MELSMYKYLLIISLLLLSVEAKEVEVTSMSDLEAVDSNQSVEVPLHYVDFDWDVGIMGGLTYDGIQLDAERRSLGLGLNVGYHITDGMSIQGEYIAYLTTYANYDVNKKIKSRTAALSVAYDFTPDKSFGIFVKAGVGYEHLDIYNESQKHPVSLIGLGFRFKVANRVSTYIQGRWRMRLTNMSNPDNGLVATWGWDYHLGLSDEKSRLVKMSDAHNASLRTTN